VYTIKKRECVLDEREFIRSDPNELRNEHLRLYDPHGCLGTTVLESNELIERRDAILALELEGA
jgi:hypothetical protein